MRDLFLFILLGGFAIGVLVRSLVPAEAGSAFGGSFVFASFLLLLSIALFILYFVLSKQKTILYISLFIIAAGLGVLRFDIADIDRGDLILDSLVGAHVVSEGIIVDEPDERENSTQLIVRLENVLGHSVNEKALVVSDSYQSFSYGDKIILEGELKKPTGFEGDDGRYFDYASFLAKDDIFYQFFFPKTEFVSSGHGNKIKQTLFSFKRALLENITRVIPEPESSLLGGLVVGAKQSMGEKLLEDFRATGIIHIVVLSGYNVTIVAEAIMRFFSPLPAAFGMSFGAGAIVLFAIMTGASATIVRASVMALLVILARATGRTYAITRALFLAGFFMILHNPKILVFDSSFQLSFMATIGLIWLAPQIEKYFKLVPTKFQLREFAVATIATQLFVLPMILFKMGELSLVSLPVNLLILLFVPLTMLFGFLASLAGFIHMLLAIPFAYITYALLAYELKVVELFASLPFASVHIDYFPLWAALFMYSLYGLFIWRLYKK